MNHPVLATAESGIYMEDCDVVDDKSGVELLLDYIIATLSKYGHGEQPVHLRECILKPGKKLQCRLALSTVGVQGLAFNDNVNRKWISGA